MCEQVTEKEKVRKN